VSAPSRAGSQPGSSRPRTKSSYVPSVETEQVAVITPAAVKLIQSSKHPKVYCCTVRMPAPRYWIVCPAQSGSSYDLTVSTAEGKVTVFYEDQYDDSYTFVFEDPYASAPSDAVVSAWLWQGSKRDDQTSRRSTLQQRCRRRRTKRGSPCAIKGKYHVSVVMKYILASRSKNNKSMFSRKREPSLIE
jgi:hypothetical protein